VRIYIDFDGTITERDVGDSIFERFLRPELLSAGWHEHIIEEWKAGRLSSRECLAIECENTVVTRAELDGLLETHTLMPGFREFTEFCGRKRIPVEILSDGLDYYIAFILERFGIEGIPVRANRLHFTDGSLKAEFPYEDRGCGRCGNCKRWHIESNRLESERIVYVGDGYSDRYAIKSADTVFARADLAGYCDRSGIPYHPFRDFHDVLHTLENIDGAV
jgi:2-hydroxy-3-keto-5-methylthiopentenyl-1-phosphate phosphatase